MKKRKIISNFVSIWLAVLTSEIETPETLLT